MTIIRHIIAVVAVILLLTNSAPSFAADSNFSSWISELKKEAFKKGVSSVTFEKAFKNIKKPVQRVLDLDRKQPEFRQSYSRYISRAINDRRVNQGRKFLKKNHVLLRDIQKLYGVPPKYLMAFWGMETNYGGTFGGFSVIEALATLAYDERRAAFFRSELIHALKILETGDIASEKMIGSWAGAMGNFQFMPSTFTHYAVDYDGDKKRDVWGSIPDATASAAN
ncbi:MAG: lytic murein transglycosylase, partial [Alphaproteobacteria bacterium]|nr:lytic murein transglycosylase [Alphaproteobacteria bacterium]